MCGIAGTGHQRRRTRSIERCSSGCAPRCATAARTRRASTCPTASASGSSGCAIIDLETGDQPIFNEDGTVVVVLNGEIYNYRELRERLAARGHVFATAGRHRGDRPPLRGARRRAASSELHGMFAFALWDRRRRGSCWRATGSARSRSSTASATAALTLRLRARRAPARPRRPARARPRTRSTRYLAFRYVPAPRERLRGGAQAPAGLDARARARAGPGSSATGALDYARKRRSPTCARSCTRRSASSIRAATRRRLVADVPLGAFLSGGVDSAAVVAAMAEALAAARCGRSRSASSTEDFDELPLARPVAERFGTEHHELVVEPDALRDRSRGSCATTASRSPTPRRSRASTSREMARRHVTVALNGDGGDESFAGYTRYVGQAAARPRSTGVPIAVRRLLARAGRRVAPGSGRIDGLAQPRAPARRRRSPLDRPGAVRSRTCRRSTAWTATRSTRPSTASSPRRRCVPGAVADLWSASIAQLDSSTGCSTSTSRPTSRTTCW